MGAIRSYCMFLADSASRGIIPSTFVRSLVSLLRSSSCRALHITCGSDRGRVLLWLEGGYRSARLGRYEATEREGWLAVIVDDLSSERGVNSRSDAFSYSTTVRTYLNVIVNRRNRSYVHVANARSLRREKISRLLRLLCRSHTHCS